MAVSADALCVVVVVAPVVVPAVSGAAGVTEVSATWAAAPKVNASSVTLALRVRPVPDGVSPTDVIENRRPETSRPPLRTATSVRSR
jgi:hypothetical protein